MKAKDDVHQLLKSLHLTRMAEILDAELARLENDKTGQQQSFEVTQAQLAQVQQDVKARYVVSMRGPTVKLLVRSRAGEAALQEKTARLINELNQRGVRLEACGYALDLFAVEPEDLYQGIVSVGNSLNSLIGYQTKGYSLVSMN